ncbi:MAG: ATP synthase F1 subunit delta [Tenericutes bacterium]|nr:ATP synthase F1 subunit delta [Mycoplasmatota bacterium]
MTGIANQYALAVFSLAKEKDKELEYSQLLMDFSNSITEDTQKFFAHPKISILEKKTVLENVVKDGLLLNFLKVLVDNDRFFLVEACALAYKDILDGMNKVMKVTVFSKKPLTKINLNKIEKKLKTTYQKRIELTEIIDETIIGGFRVEFEGNVIDETINKQLDDLKSSLTE